MENDNRIIYWNVLKMWPITLMENENRIHQFAKIAVSSGDEERSLNATGEIQQSHHSVCAAWTMNPKFWLVAFICWNGEFVPSFKNFPSKLFFFCIHSISTLQFVIF